MSFYFSVGLNFLLCVAAGFMWGKAASEWWGKRWGIPLGLALFGLMFYSIFSDYHEYLNSY